MAPLDESTAGAPLLDEGRHDRPNCMAFVMDSATEAAIQEGLSDVMPGGVESRRGGIRAAIATMQKMPTPRVLIVDLGGDDSPLSALEELSDVVEPHVCVLVVGDLTSLDFYREVTRGVGAMEYLSKPLTREVVARHFGPLAQGRAPTGEAALGGRLLTVTGVRGGVGASTIAVNLAWFFGVTSRRHTVLLDSDLHFGTSSFLLNVPPGRGLSMALQTPERIDSLLAERAAQPVSDRLHVLATQEPLAEIHSHAALATETLMHALRRRYNFIIADVPFRPVPLNRELLDLSHRRILVMDPTLASVRDALRLMAMRAGPEQSRRPILVLNRQGLPGGLNRRQFEDALKMKVDVTIPDLPKQVGQAATLGKPAVAARGAFQQAIKDLSSQVAFSRLLDVADMGVDAGPAGGAGRWSLARLFGKK
jgi:pilus assembly protein CpaE